MIAANQSLPEHNVADAEATASIDALGIIVNTRPATRASGVPVVPIDFLSDDEVLALTRPKVQPAAQKRFLKRIGIPYIVRPDGRPIISRGALAGRLALGGENAPAANVAVARQEPNRAKLLARLGNQKKRGAKNGTTA